MYMFIYIKKQNKLRKTWFETFVPDGTNVNMTFCRCRHDIAEILLKVALNTKNHQSSYFCRL